MADPREPFGKPATQTPASSKQGGTVGTSGAKSLRAGAPPLNALTTEQQMKQRIALQASKFSLGALQDALHSIGFDDDEIEFRSHATTTHQDNVVSAVQFFDSPRRRAVVTLNLGLLAPQSLLPSYFQKVMARQAEDSLSGFLNFLSHHLLGDLVHGQFPERDSSLFASWPDTIDQLRSLLGVRTLSTVHFLFEQFYPELGVSVSRLAMSRTLRSRGVHLGQWKIGDGAVLGAISQTPVSGISVKLFADEAFTGYGKPWAQEAMARLTHRLFPVLTRQGLHLEVMLILRDQRNFMILAPKQYLGYVPLYGGVAKTEQPRSVRTIILWSGEIPVS